VNTAVPRSVAPLYTETLAKSEDAPDVSTRPTFVRLTSSFEARNLNVPTFTPVVPAATVE
jgi:hypothetical protein